MEYCLLENEWQNLEHWLNIKFCAEIGKSASETLNLLT
jgi:hypothetical protein